MTSAPAITFTLGAASKTLNVIRGMHHRVYAKHRRAIAAEVAALTVGQKPAQPFAKARVRVMRYGSRSVDIDNVTGGIKPLLDVLQPFHLKIRPDGLGFIASDAPSYLDLEVVAVMAPKGECRTVVEIYEVVS